ncbi:MAG: DUF4347 domain-containing protein, partial [Elainella sp. C42_A2020_010]|nr:DUF4347 domain-containing protein [Elainella sp. C42_A2020_010]
MSNLQSLSPTEIAFVDVGVADSSSLIAQFQAGTEVHLLDASQDAIEQITQVLANRTDVSAVHLVSHGRNGALQLGGDTISDLSEYTAALKLWSNSLTADADILLYGCSVAANAAGVAFVQSLAQLTGADVAASDDLTGQGGDWNLEYQTGQVETVSMAAFSYSSTLATFTVSNTNDSGAGSLRQAILDANAAAGADTINVTATGTITLTTGQLTITDSVSINGNGITISGNNSSRVFNIDSGNIVADRTVSLDRVTITGGNAGGFDGGGIRSREILTVTNSTISNSVSRAGGGIDSNGSLSVANSTISNNSSTFGGGIVSNSELFGPITVIRNSTISGNSSGAGGGIYNFNGLLQLRNSTVTANSAPAGRGSGVISVGSDIRTEVVSSIIAGNSSSDVDFDGITNTFLSQGNNLIGTGNATGNFNQSTDQTGITNPGLAALANNGGPTQTHALQAGSAAINRGSNPNGLTTDQRGPGFARVINGTIDIGAFESSFLPNSPPTTAGIANVTVNEDAPATVINLFDAFADA